MSLAGKCICFTGGLNTMKRAEATQKAKDAGATVAGSVTKKVNVLVVGEDGAFTNKSFAGTHVLHWTEAQFLRALKAAKGKKTRPAPKPKKAPSKRAKKAPAPRAKKAPAPKAKRAGTKKYNININIKEV